MDSCKYSELIFDRGAKKFNGRRMIFSTVSTRAVGHPQQPPPSQPNIPYTKIKVDHRRQCKV